MLKKRIISLLLIVILSLSAVANGVQAANDYIDESKVNSGVIKVNYTSSKGAAIRVSKGNINYDYLLNENNIFPLQLGNGQYTVSILENVDGNKYKQVSREVVTLNSNNANDVYLQSIQMINWNRDMDAIKKAEELVKNAKTDREKIQAIYNYVINISYDYDKASKINSNYIPNIDDVLRLQRGICYDYASLFAGMLRSSGIPTKLVMGHKSDIIEYHAWNEVYLEDANEWIIIDTTYDAGLGNENAKSSMIKDASEYKVEKVY